MTKMGIKIDKNSTKISLFFVHFGIAAREVPPVDPSLW